MDYLTLLKTVERGAAPALVLIHGGDAQLLDDVLAAATRALFRPGEIQLGREVLDGTEVTADTLVRSAMTLPFMTARRLVAVRRCQALDARTGAALTAYARDPNPATCLLLLADEPLAASRERRADHWLLQAVPSAATVALPARKERALEEWLRQRAALEGLTIDEEAAHLLVQWVGDDGAALMGEARKAALAGGSDNRTVGEREVKAVVGEHRVFDAFTLTNAVTAGDIGLALKTLDRLLTTEPPLRLLALLLNDVRMVMTVADLAAQQQPVAVIARTVRRPPAVVEGLVRAAARTSGATRTARLRRCWEVDWRLKSGGAALAEMTALVAALCADR
ncbi:MAG TPA: DNA polymerase III subunit delta [Candidatus Limnocylindria bacterium]|nr:DNA polymerase III subunit delta [Candidatus Limnocylindria bacterium]